MKRCLPLFVFSLAILTARADPAPAPRPDITLADGRVLKACKVMSADPAALVILHSGGVDTVPFESLPAEIQQAHGFDAAKAAEHRANVAEVAAQQAAAVQEKARQAELRGKAFAADARRRQALEQTQINAVLEVLQVVDGGILAKGYGKIGPAAYADVQQSAIVNGTGLDAGRVVQRTWNERQDTRPLLDLGDRFFVACETDGLIDGQTVKAVMWPDGTYAYTNTLGARMTVRKFTTSP